MRLRFLGCAVAVLGLFFFFDVTLGVYLQGVDHGALASRTKTAEAWLQELQDDADPTRRTRAADALWKFGEPVVPAVVDCLQHNSIRVRSSACLALNRMGPTARAAVPDLIRLVRDPNEPIRLQAIQALGSIGPAAQPATNILAEAARDKDRQIGHAATNALAGIGPAAIHSLLALADCNDPEIQRWAMYALTETECRSPRICDALAPLAANGDADVHCKAFSALAVQGALARHHLETLLHDRHAPIRAHAAMTLCMIGADAQAAVPTILNAIHDADANTRFWALRALAVLKLEAADRNRILKVLDDPEADVRWQAKYTLAQTNRSHVK